MSLWAVEFGCERFRGRILGCIELLGCTFVTPMDTWYIYGAHVAPMWQLGTHWDTLSYMEWMFPCWGTWKLPHGMACSHMETHVAHLHMMHVPTWKVCPHVPMLGLGCVPTWDHLTWQECMFPNMGTFNLPKCGNTFQSFCDTSCSHGAYGAIGNALGTYVPKCVCKFPTWEHMFPCWGNNAIDYICGSDRVPSPTSKWHVFKLPSGCLFILACKLYAQYFLQITIA